MAVHLFARDLSLLSCGAFVLIEFLLLALGLLWAILALVGSREAGDTVGVALSVVGLLLSGGTLALAFGLVAWAMITGSS